MSAITIPFLPSETNYVLAVPIDDTQVLFDIRWNSRDAAWYFDMYESNDNPIAINVKVVLGIPLGRRSQHSFFQNHMLLAVDTTGSGLEPGFDELGARVNIVVITPTDL